ncbi:uncharacterized protein [Epargyreus clarus]|uniref:uncharacterized protein n=1 Tax=Epargyreus clarus TaxID=520877 RepID=UPI003C2D7630
MLYFVILFKFGITLQMCEEEFTENGISVTWQRSPPANNVLSDPLCYYDDNLITRNCTNANWSPSLPELKPCLQVIKQYDLLACPPSFHRISEKNDEYCYQISEPSPWKYPCFRSGGASLITDLSEDDVLSLLHSLRSKNISRFFWLPARRVKIFNPVLWYIPGPKWGWQVRANNSLRVQTSLMKNCLLLDVQLNIIITEACTKQYPSLCFYINDMHYPAKCPEKYHAVRFMPNDGVCYGIEKSVPKLTFDGFLRNKCSNPMGDGKNNDLTRFIFKKIAELNNLPDDVWCWFTRKRTHNSHVFRGNTNVGNNPSNTTCTQSLITINNIGTLSLLNSCSLTALPCMACETEMIYGETEFLFEYSVEEQLMYLTVYFPSGLWKYNYNDRGIQCFSNAKGFVNVVEIMEIPFIEMTSFISGRNDSDAVEKTVYIINLVTDRSAQYWCEGHTKNFSLISTDKIVVNPKGNKEHVFSLVIKTFISNDDIYNLEENVMVKLSENITAIFGAKKALIMDILEYSMDHLLVLFHLHVEIANHYNDHSRNIVSTYNKLKTTAQQELIKFNYTFVNISSSLFCLPTTSVDNSIILDWEITSIGHIAAPTQFCLQANGLPVKRFCSGSYLLGSYWANIEGTCDKNYVASETTTFLYNFVKGQVSENYTSRFLIDGLGFVLDDIDGIIPADIYYLSMSLKHVLSIAQVNHTLVDMGDIDNMAWVMDRVLSLDCSYLRLAQTLNSTNVILDSVNDIIEILSYKKSSVTQSLRNVINKDSEVLAIQPQCVIQISYPFINNVSGIAIINKEVANNFTEMEIKPLYRNSTLDDVLSMPNLEVAAWLPDNVLNSLMMKTNNTSNETIDYENVYIIITVFHNDAIFQELEENDHEINSRIIGISVPGFILNLNNHVPLIFKNLRPSNSKKFCGYWDFEAHKKENIPGSWSRRGCFVKKSVGNMTICECYHLTHFGNLLNIGNSNNVKDIKEQHSRALNIITLVGSFLSLIGVTCIWITASVFQTWRKKAGTKVLLHLSTSIALPLLFIVVFNLDNTIFKEKNGMFIIDDHKKVICIVLGAILHYSILASFMWMLITAFLQFIRYVRVLGVRRPSRFMLKLTIVGWGTPVIPVLAVLLINKDNYIPNLSTCNKCSICYPKDIYLILSVVVPVCIILMINICLFVVVLWSISKGPDGKMRTTDLDLIGAQLRLSVFLFFLLGLTWVFGIFSFSNNLIWSYLFCLTSSLQGFVLFVYFILCDPNTRNLWVTLMKPHHRPNLPRESVTSISSG